MDAGSSFSARGGDDGSASRQGVGAGLRVWTEVSFDDHCPPQQQNLQRYPNRGEDESKFEVANGARNIAPSAHLDHNLRL